MDKGTPGPVFIKFPQAGQRTIINQQHNQKLQVEPYIFGVHTASIGDLHFGDFCVNM